MMPVYLTQLMLKKVKDSSNDLFHAFALLLIIHISKGLLYVICFVLVVFRYIDTVVWALHLIIVLIFI